MTDRLRVIPFVLATLALLLGTSGEVRADALCTPASGAPVFQMDPAGEGLEGQTCDGDLVIQQGTVVSAVNGAGMLTVSGDLTVAAGATLAVVNTPATATIDVGGHLFLEAFSVIDLLGQSGVVEPAGTGGAGRGAPYCAGSGAGHGGRGGGAWDLRNHKVTPGGAIYGIAAAAQYPGSRGGPGYKSTVPALVGGDGGGAVRIIVGGTTVLDGQIRADGAPGADPSSFLVDGYASGGGSGGAIFLRTTDLLTHEASVHLSAAGGRGGNGNPNLGCSGGGGGGGGRISAYFSGLNGDSSTLPLQAGEPARFAIAAAHLSCAGGLRGANDAQNFDGEAGTCAVTQAGVPPAVQTFQPPAIGQGAVQVPVTVTGTDIAAFAALDIGGATPGSPAGGITVDAVQVFPPDRITGLVSVDYTAVAEVKPIRVVNPDANASAPAPLLTVTLAPVLSGIRAGGVPVTGLPRGFNGAVEVSGQNFQPGATLVFNSPWITVGPMPVLDAAAGTLTNSITISELAPAGPVTFRVANADGGTPQVPGTLDILSVPQITEIRPAQLFQGQTVSVVVAGSGFIPASVVNVGGTGVIVESVTYDSFTQLTARITASVETNLLETCASGTGACRDLWVDNGDGGVATAVPMQILAPPADANTAQLGYGDGTVIPKTRTWNGFGWGAEQSTASGLPQPPDWVVLRTGLANDGRFLLATVDAGRQLRYQENSAAGWGPLSTQVPVAGVAAQRPVDVVSIVGASRYLMAYGSTDGSLQYRLIGDTVLQGVVPATDPACAAGTAVWVRVSADRSGSQAIVAHARDTGALCASVWDAVAGFGNETVLAAPGELSTLNSRAFDVTYWGGTGSQGMAAWGVAGNSRPGFAIWDGAAWTIRGSALGATSSTSDAIVALQLAASNRSNRVALIDSTSIGELFSQFWGGSRWGTTVNELSVPLVANPSRIAAPGTARAFDVAWPMTRDAAILVYGLDGFPAPRARTWTPAGAWGGETVLQSPVGSADPRWVQVDADPASGQVLAGVVDWAGDPAVPGGLSAYAWTGSNWNPGQQLSATVPWDGQGFMVDYDRAVPQPPVVSATSYKGASPAAIGARSSGQTITVSGTGFLNPVTVSFEWPGIQVANLSYASTSTLFVTLNIGDVPPGTYAMTVTNPDGQSSRLATALQVLPAPGGITVSLDAGAPPCVPSDPALSCIHQDSALVPVVVRGSGIVPGASVLIEGDGVQFVGPTAFVDNGDGTVSLSGQVNVLGTASPGVRNVRVTNPDSSTGTGLLEIKRLVEVTSITPAVVGTGASGVPLTVQGRNFQAGVTFDLGAGVLIDSVTLNGPNEAVLVVSVSPLATPSDRTVTATNPDGGQAVVATPGFFAIVQGPVVTSVQPPQGDQGTTVRMVVQGSNLSLVDTASGIRVSGGGIIIQNPLIVSDTRIEFDVVIAATAPFGTLRDVEVVDTHSGRALARSVFDVRPVPRLGSIDPPSTVAGQSGRQLTLNGSGFHPGAVAVVDAGVVLVNQTVVDQTRIVVTADILAGPQANFTVVNPDGSVSNVVALNISSTAAACDINGVTVALTAADELNCSTLTISGGGQLVLQGDLTLSVAGDANVLDGAIVVDPGQQYVRLRVGGNLNVSSTGAILATGTGHAGGQSGQRGEGPGGGRPSSTDTAKDDQGTGGGYGGPGGDGTRAGAGGPTNDLSGVCSGAACFGGIPLRMGSGGGSAFAFLDAGRPAWRRGGAGGGAVVLDVAGGVTVDGQIVADGTGGTQYPYFSDGTQSTTWFGGKGAGGGSGGTILVLADTIAGTGTFRAAGGNTNVPGYQKVVWSGTGGGGGRVSLFHRTANTFAGTLNCSGGVSPSALPSYQGQPGTCLTAPEPASFSVQPTVIGQGGTGDLTFSGPDLAAGDEVFIPGGGVTAGPLALVGAELRSAYSVLSGTPIGTRDAVVRLGGGTGQTGAVLFHGLEVVTPPRLFSMTPDRLVAGQTVTGTVNGSFLDPAGASLTFLQGGVAPACAAGACVTAVIDVANSTLGSLALSSVQVQPDAPAGSYDVLLTHGNGLTTLMQQATTVTNGTTPALSAISPNELGEGLTDAPVQLFGYDFGIPGAFQVSQLAASAGSGVSIGFDPSGCPLVPATCVADAAAQQRIDALVSTVGAVTGSPVDISVSTGTAGSTLFGGLTVNPAPLITGFSPASGQSAFTLLVTGANFQPGAVISLSDLSLLLGSATGTAGQLSVPVMVPAGIPAETVEVRVTNPDGGTHVMGGLGINLPPVITALNPASLGLGETGLVTVSGDHFHPNAAISFGAGITVTGVNYLNPGSIQVQVSVAATALPGTRTVTLTNPNGESGQRVDGFLVEGPLLLSRVLPSAVGVGAGTRIVRIPVSPGVFEQYPEGFSITLTGQNIPASTTLSDITFSNPGIQMLTLDHKVFDPANPGQYPTPVISLANYRAITVGDVTITSGDLMIQVPPGTVPGPGTVTVQNRKGQTSTVSFTVNPGPIISLVTPGTVVIGKSQDVTITGFNFDLVKPQVCFGGNCSFASGLPVDVAKVVPRSPNEMGVTVDVSPSATPGFTAVKVRNPDGGFTVKQGIFNVVAGFSASPVGPIDVDRGAQGVAAQLTGTGFTDAGAPIQVIVLSPDGRVDGLVSVAVTFDAINAPNTLTLSISADAAALPGLRTLRIINGDGATLDLPGVLLVTNPAGPTVGELRVPVGDGTYREAVLGLDEAGVRTVNGVQLTGKGLSVGALSVSFVDGSGTPWPGLSVANLQVVDDRLATFDLSLAAVTPAGPVSLTADDGSAADTRSGVLMVNAAPALTVLQPNTIHRGESNVSVRIDGGGFQQGAEIAVTPLGAGLTVADLDTSVPGVQVYWIGSQSVRTVLNAGNTAQGSYVLAVTNPDGGRGSAVFTVSDTAPGTPAKVAYLAESTETGLKVRDWIGASPILGPIVSGSTSPDLPHIATREDQWTEIRSNPRAPGQYLLAVGQARSAALLRSGLKVYRTLADGTRWEQLDGIAALASDTTQVFDLAFEQAGTGRALMVYGSAAGTLVHKVIENVPTAQGPVVNRGPVLVGGNVPGAQGTPLWVRLIPKPNSQQILVLYVTASRQIQALIWDGSADAGNGAFISQFGEGTGTLSVNASSGIAGRITRSVDGAWEAGSGRAVVFWGEENASTLSAVSWDEVTGWGVPVLSPVVLAATGAAFVEAEAAPEGNDVAVLATMKDALLTPAQVAYFWNGGAWGASQALALDTYYWDLAVPGRAFDLAWTDTGKVVALYAAFSARGFIEYRVWTPAAGWTPRWELPVNYPDTDLIPTAIEIARDPETGKLLAVVVDRGGAPGQGALITRLYRWEGNGWVGPERLAGGVQHWIDIGTRRQYGTAATLAFREDLVAPDKVILTQVDADATGATVSWTVPGDNGAVGQAGGYDIRWSNLTIVDDGAVIDCAAPPAGQICFSKAQQVPALPLPGTPGSTQQLHIEFGAPGVYTVALKTGDRPNRTDPATGLEVLQGNASPISTDAAGQVLSVVTLPEDLDPPEMVADLAVAPGPNPESMAVLTWTGVGDDGSQPVTGPVRAYDLRVATLPISEVGGYNNFDIPFDRVSRSEVVLPATDGSGGTRGVANSFTVTGLEPGVTYYLAVKGLDEDPTHYAPISNVVAYTTPVVVPDPIADFQVAGVGANEVSLTWTAPGGAPEFYDLRWSNQTIVDDAIVADCSTPPAGRICFSRAPRVPSPPSPAPAGVRQAFTVYGLFPDTAYSFALVPVRNQNVNGQFTRLAPAPSVAMARTLPAQGEAGVQPLAISDLSVVSGSVRTGEARLTWTAPVGSGERLLRYELRWAVVPTAGAAPEQLNVVPVPLLPSPAGTTEEFTVTGLPENAVIYVVLVSYDRFGLASQPSNEIVVHTALRRGMNAVSVPGLLLAPEVGTVLGPFVGQCGSGGIMTGSGPVGACAGGEPPTVLAYRWDPAAGTAGAFVEMLQTDPLETGEGIFVYAPGTMAVADVAGLDQAAFPPVPLPHAAPALIANPYLLPVAVANLRIVGSDGYNQPFGQAVGDGVVNGELLYYTREGGVEQFVPVGPTEQMLAYRAYFIQLGVLADPAVAYSVEVPHP